MIRVAASLTNRIFVASTLLATLSLGLAFYFANARAAAEAEAELQRGLDEAATLVDQHRATLTETNTRMARLVADLPKLKAAVVTMDPPTVQPIAEEYGSQIDADLLVVSDPAGVLLGSVGAETDALPVPNETSVSIDEFSTFLPHARGVLHVVSVPIWVGLEATEVLGRLTVGFFLDDRRAAQFKRLTGSEVAFAAGGRVLASSLPADARDALGRAIGPQGTFAIDLRDEEYLAVARPMHAEVDAEGPVILVLRSRTERLRFLNTLRAGLVGALVVTILLATILSYFVARTMTRPLSAVTNAMRDVAATGDLTRRVPVRSRAWDDADARLLASTFNTLTESIDQFQREAAQKERLSSLGRLSTVIAHEIRNPLMIVRASLATLRNDRVTRAEMRDAVADIDEETTRLNRIVTEVLDFAKPIRFDLSNSDLNELCRASAAAAWTGESESSVQLDLDQSLPPIVTDAERLRTVLVNIVTNARHAVDAAAAASERASHTADVAVARRPSVIVTTRRRGEHVTLTVRDRGVGIAPDDMAHIFDPYFTTKRTGTGLGLPISKNIIEGLGGTIAVTSRLGHGTEIRIELPLTPRRAGLLDTPPAPSAPESAA